MTKKDYKLIAKAMRGSKPHSDYEEVDQLEIDTWEGSVIALAHRLKEDDPKFDFDKFYIACGYIE